LISDLEARINGLRGAMLFRLTQVIDDSLSHADTNWEEAVKSAVSVATEDWFNNASRDFANAFSKEAHDILADHKHQVDALVDEIRRTTAEMFDVALAPECEPGGFRLGEEPYWITERLASTLIPDCRRMLDHFLPAASRRRRRRAHIVEQANEMIIRNAENLRWAMLRGIDETFRAAATHFEDRLAEAIGATKRIIEEALARRRDRSFASEATLDRLDRSMDALALAQRAFSG
jgi:hypothetical protein